MVTYNISQNISPLHKMGVVGVCHRLETDGYFFPLGLLVNFLLHLLQVVHVFSWYTYKRPVPRSVKVDPKIIIKVGQAKVVSTNM
jgi:hypothetical protein